jgi:hypothetical protein
LPSSELCEFLDRDESCVSWEASPFWCGVWAASRENIPETPVTKIDSVKGMISIIWFISGIHSLLALAKGMKYNSQSFCQDVIPDIQQTICSSSHRKTLKDILVHSDNAQLIIRDFLQKG